MNAVKPMKRQPRNGSQLRVRRRMEHAYSWAAPAEYINALGARADLKDKGIFRPGSTGLCMGAKVIDTYWLTLPIGCHYRRHQNNERTRTPTAHIRSHRLADNPRADLGDKLGRHGCFK